MKLLLTMGYHLENPDPQGRWLYGRAALLVIDWDSEKILREFTYVSPPGQAAMSGHMLFAYGHLDRERLLVTSHTEVLLFNLRTWQVERVLSSPHFNDLHSALPGEEDTVYVCNTGLQSVQRFTWEGRLLETHSTTDVPTWDAYDPQLDYRPLSTKPHPIHPNFLFRQQDELWVTRLRKNDAVAVRDHSRRLAVRAGDPHDGTPHDGLVWFTTTNGHVVGVDPATGEQTRDIDLNALDHRHQQLGWCRGLHFIDNQRAFVGFGQFRRTMHKQLVHWILRDGKAKLPTRVALYDFGEPRLMKELSFTGAREGSCIYSIYTLPDDLIS